MICKKCGNLLAEDSVFCPYCGEKAERGASRAPGGSFFSAAGDIGDTAGSTFARPHGGETLKRGPETTSFSPAHAEDTDASWWGKEPVGGTPGSAAWVPDRTEEPGEGASQYCPNCGAKMEPGSKFCGACGAAIMKAPASGKRLPLKVLKNFKDLPPKKKKLAGIVAASVAALCIVIFAVLGIMSIATDGPLKRISSAISNTLNAKSLTADVQYFENYNLDIEFYAEAALNLKKKEITAMATAPDGDAVALYNGYFLEVYDYGDEVRVYKEDVSEQISYLMDQYSKISSGKFNISKAANTREERETIERLEEDVDLDRLNDCLKDFLKALNDEQWLKQNAGYSVSKIGDQTTYSFSITPQTISAFMEILRPAFLSQAKYLSVREDVTDDDIGGYITIITQGKYLKQVNVTSIERYGDLSYVVKFSQIGSTAVDRQQIANWFSMARD